jgi:pimeloyl-ACP methyl ester carboxylesterase
VIVDDNAETVRDRVTGHARVGPRRLRWSSEGDGTPAVLLEAGLGGGCNHWGRIPEALGRTTRVVTYDRAGYGGSDPVRHVTAEQFVLDLDAVLADAGATGPVILVGHSWGGLLARLYASERGDRVAALVLLDATHEGLRSSHSSLVLYVNRLALRLMAFRARLGFARRSLRSGRGQLGGLLATLPADRRAAAIDELSRPSVPRQANRELSSVATLLHRVADAPSPTAPVVAVVGSKAEKRGVARQRREMRSVYQAWIAGLADGRFVDAANSGHSVQLDDPDLVVDVVRDVLAQVRR